MSQKVPYKQSKVSPGPIQQIDLNFTVVYAKTWGLKFIKRNPMVNEFLWRCWHSQLGKNCDFSRNHFCIISTEYEHNFLLRTPKASSFPFGVSYSSFKINWSENCNSYFQFMLIFFSLLFCAVVIAWQNVLNILHFRFPAFIKFDLEYLWESLNIS